MARPGLTQRMAAAMRAFLDPKRMQNGPSLHQDIQQRVEQETAKYLLKEEFLETIKKTAQRGTADAINKGGFYRGTCLSKDLAKLSRQYEDAVPRRMRFVNIVQNALEQHGLANGMMLEIGAREQGFEAEFRNFTYRNLDIRGDENERTLIGDITNCPELRDAQFDLIISHDVFEHIAKPWDAGKEITRLLKPGGITVHTTLFSWRYHPCPIDYWRFTPEGLAALFPDLDRVHAGFDLTERRRDLRGRGRFSVKPDFLGGFRENIRVNYAGQKPR